MQDKEKMNGSKIGEQLKSNPNPIKFRLGKKP